MLQDFSIEEDIDKAREWYNGYTIGTIKNIYNPWSIINYVQYHREGLKPYWLNTSSNLMVKDLMARGGVDLKQDIESLIQNKTIEKRIDPYIVFQDLERNTEAVWTLFLFSGYLKAISRRTEEAHKLFYTLSIPNYEVTTLFERFLEQWLTDFLPNQDIEYLVKSLLTGDSEILEAILQKYMKQSMSYF